MSDLLARARAALDEQFEVQREIGRGGMATVFLAEDRKHGRKVAVKILKPDLAASIGVERFHREIRLAANLQHPHILALYDSGESGNLIYFVMPFVDGESLRQRVAREGELPVADALKILREVADALAYAHEQGVVHRDIKPDNILLSGRHALVTDFGVAKAVTDAAGEDGLTTAGIALGTPTYMSPEQAAADPHVDSRTDIYALGIVAYEILTGRPPFTGNTPQSILAAQVQQEPDPLSRYREHLPPGVEAIVMRCLAKRPADRWQTADEVVSQLESVTMPSGGVTPTDTRPIRAADVAPRRRAPLLAGGLVVAALAAAGVLWVGGAPGAPNLAVSDLRQVTREAGGEYAPAISPEGRDVAYVVSGEAGPYNQRLAVRDLGGGRPLIIETDAPLPHMIPRWTPDGREIGLTAGITAREWQVYLVPRLGGNARVLVPGALWDFFGDRIAYSHGETLYVAARDGDDTRPIASGEAHSAAFSPDGTLLAWVEGNFNYLLLGNPGNVAPSAILVGRIGAVPDTVVADGSINQNPIWSPDGRYLFWISDRDGSRDVFVQAVGRDGRPQGSAQRLTTGFEPLNMALVGGDDWRIVAARYRAQRNIWAVTLPTGSAPPVSISTGHAITRTNQVLENHGLSADGRWMAFDMQYEGSEDIFVMPADGSGEPRRVTRHPADEFHPDFSPDGTQLAFHSPRMGTRDVYIINADGTGEQRITSLSGEEYHPTWSPDGLHIAFTYGLIQGKRSLYVISREAPGGPWSEPRLLADTIANQARWLPGNRLVVNNDRGLNIVSLDGQITPVPIRGVFALSDVQADQRGRIFFQGTDNQEREGIFEIGPAGGTPIARIWMDNPRMDVAFLNTIGNGMMYMTAAEPESDLWEMKVERN